MHVVKLGYPPRALTLIPELPLSSLGLQRGDQLVVTDTGLGGHRVSGSSSSGVGPTLGGLPVSPTRTVASKPAATAAKPQPGAIPSVNKPVTRTSSAPAQPQPAARPAAPRASTPPPSRTQPSSSSGPETVRTDAGILVHRVVPDDNSCLFASIGIIFEQSQSAAPKLRQLVADAITKDELVYDEAFLG